MTAHEIYENRRANLKSLFEISKASQLSFCEKNKLSIKKIAKAINTLDYEIQDRFSREIENALTLPEFTLDQDVSLLRREADLVRQNTIDELNCFFGNGEYSNRYWNIRKFIDSNDISFVSFSKSTGIQSVYCTQLFSKKPVFRITDARARVVEKAYGLPHLSLDEHAEENPFRIASAEDVSDAGILFLGTGAYLNRYLNIKKHCQDNRVSITEIYSIPGFKWCSYEQMVAETPSRVINQSAARSFEDHFGLAPGSVDKPCKSFDYSGLYVIFTVTHNAFSRSGGGEPLYRYVNLRRLMLDMGVNLVDFARAINKTKAYVHAILSDNPKDSIGTEAARNIESILRLEAMSLDQTVTFTLEDPKAPLKRRQPAQADDLQP